MNKSKGFTIVELVVVVAIIAILAALVLINVTQYINKSKNSAIKSNLSSALTNAAVFYSSNGTYTDFCIDSSYVNIGDEVTTIVGAAPTCVDSATAWCACSDMKITDEEPSGSTFCVDSSGYKRVTGTDCATRCPAGGVCVD